MLLESPLLAGLRDAAMVAVNVLLPPRCLLCGRMVDAPGALCGECWRAVSFLEPPLCARCGLPFDIDPGPQAICAACARRPPRFARARAVFRYDDASKGLILRFKHADRVGGAPHFARWMARAGAALLADAEVIVPVPLHRWRLLARRYNQAALLSVALGRLSGVPSVPDALNRVRHTASQGTMGRLWRASNVRGAFALQRPQAVRDRRVLLIDDVLTSGATINECASVLLRGGAVAVDVLTLARVVLES
jgi:ComF family protein